jgi:hypothetical protein
VYEFLPNEFSLIYPKEHKPKDNLNRKTHNKISVKPTFEKKSIDSIYNKLKNFFSLEEQKDLGRVLSTGGNVSNQLHFKAEGIKLLYFLRLLFEGRKITGCSKKDLEKWVCKTFTYGKEDSIQFTGDYVHHGISNRQYPSKYPIIKNVTEIN